jgi:hypothetical protein
MRTMQSFFCDDKQRVSGMSFRGSYLTASKRCNSSINDFRDSSLVLVQLVSVFSIGRSVHEQDCLFRI